MIKNLLQNSTDFYEKDVLKNFAKFTGKQSIFVDFKGDSLEYILVLPNALILLSSKLLIAPFQLSNYILYSTPGIYYFATQSYNVNRAFCVVQVLEKAR